MSVVQELASVGSDLEHSSLNILRSMYLLAPWLLLGGPREAGVGGMAVGGQCRRRSDGEPQSLLEQVCNRGAHPSPITN